MTKIVKLAGSEATLNATPSNVNGAKCVRVANTSASAALITLKDASAATLGTVTVLPGSVDYIAKDVTDTLISSVTSGVLGVSVGF